MADLQSLHVVGNIVFDAPGADDKAPIRKIDLKTWVPAAPATKTSAGSPGNYFSNGQWLWICYATNQWARCAVVADWTPDS